MAEDDKKEEGGIGKPLPVTRKPVKSGPQAGEPVDLSEEDVTPISREEIKKVNAGQWSDLNIAQLYTQLTTLQNRLAFARQIGNQDMITQLNQGIQRLNALIHEKTDGDIKLI